MIARRAWLPIILILVSTVLVITGTTVAAKEDQKDTTPPWIIIRSPLSALSTRSISGGGAVDANCQATVSFEARIIDNCCICPDGVTVEVTLTDETTGNATLSDLAITMTHIDHPSEAPEGEEVSLSGSVVVSALTECPATVQVIINATDCAGNAAIPATWTMDVTDETPPTITCPTNVEVCADAGDTSAIVDPGMATATDNCDPSPQVTGVRSDEQARTAPYPVGTTTITWTATDACNNPSQCDQTVTVWANPDCTITAPLEVCELCTGFTASVHDAGPGATYDWTITGGTITDGQGTNSITWDAGAAGTVTLQVRVTDANGCSNTCTKDVTVLAPAVGPAVGGEVYPINKLAILAPWIALFGGIPVCAVILRRRRTHG